MPLCEGHLCKQMQADAADITTHVPQRGHPNRYNNPICMALDYNSRPSTRGIISMIAGASPMELLQFSPLCEGHPHLVQRTHRAAVITTHAPSARGI